MNCATKHSRTPTFVSEPDANEGKEMGTGLTGLAQNLLTRVSNDDFCEITSESVHRDIKQRASVGAVETPGRTT